MTGITKLEASILWGNGFKLQDKEGDEYSIVAVYDDKFKVSCDNPEMYNSPFDLKYDAIGNIAFIIARPLSQLTQEIEPGIVPIVELAKIENTSEDWEQGDIHRNWAISDRYIFGFESGGFFTESHTDGCNIQVSNQPALFAYMDSLHFDRFNWKERGLTVDKSK